MIANDGRLVIEELDLCKECSLEKVANQVVLKEVLNQMIAELQQEQETRINVKDLL